MTTLIKILGWAANLGLAALLIDGFFGPAAAHLSGHIRWGLGLTLFLPLVYLLPYFHLIGVTARLKARTEKDPNNGDALRLAVKLKAKLFWPVLVAVFACILGPILGFLQQVGEIPHLAHGFYMVGFSAVHVATWVRSLFVLELSAQLVAIE